MNLVEPAPLSLRNGEAADRAAIPVLPPPAFRAEVLRAFGSGSKLAGLFGAPGDGGPRVHAVLADPATGTFAVLAMDPGPAYPALTPACPAAHLFERELCETWAVTPAGHPWLKPVRRAAGSAGAEGFYRVEGPEIHEVAVGPVHAGVIEPGHFRFQCHGEEVLHLEIALGYQHRGVARALAGGPGPRTLPYMETLAGDSTAAHATAYAHVREALGGVTAPARGLALRAVALELERLANHVGDLGALAGDVGYLPTQSFCGRLRGEFLNLTAELCGSRLGRGLVRPGGAGFDADGDLPARMRDRLARAVADVRDAVGLLWATPSVMDRFESTGPVAPADAISLGLVGPAARACGLPRDARRNFPLGDFASGSPEPAIQTAGDVLARARVRWLEVERSARWLDDRLTRLPAGPVRVAVPAPAPHRIALAFVEGWRGEILHAALTGPDGRFAAYQVVDPSFHNWMGLAVALRGQEISDFPLCNKSFNLSYCGHDL